MPCPPARPTESESPERACVPACFQLARPSRYTLRLGSSTSPVLRLENVTKTYRADGEEVHALDGVSLDAAAGDFIAIVGRSGCGKTTLLNLAGAMDFPNADTAVASPLAQRLFEVDGVSGVFLGSDFITVTKSAGEWQHLKPALLGAIMDHFTSGAPMLAQEGGEVAAAHADYDGEDEELVTQIKDLLDTRVRPAVAQDGGDIVFHGYKEGTVFLHLRGACAGCPSSEMTLKNGIENLLRHYIPEVEQVEAV